MKRLLIHIGTGKTGTSTIQNFLFANQKKLAAKFSIFYPEQGLSKIDHFGEEIHAHYPIVSWLNNRETESLDKLIHSINSSACETAIISCENFYHHLQTESIAYLGSVFKDYSVEIICYVRRQDQYMESAWKQQIKVGAMKMAFADFLQRHTHEKYLNEVHANYYRMLKPWANVFGMDAIKVKVFDKSEWVEHDLIADFLNTCAIDEKHALSVLTKPNLTNLALPTGLIRILQKTNAKGLIPREEQQSFVMYLNKLTLFNNAALLSTQDRLAVIRNYSQSNAQLFSEFNKKEIPKCFQLSAIQATEKENTPPPSLEDIAILSLVENWQQSKRLSEKLSVSSLFKSGYKSYKQKRNRLSKLLFSKKTKTAATNLQNSFWIEDCLNFQICKQFSEHLLQHKTIDVKQHQPILKNLLSSLKIITLGELEPPFSKEGTIAAIQFLPHSGYEVTVQNTPRLSEILMRLLPLCRYAELFCKKFPNAAGVLHLSLADEPKANAAILAFCSNQKTHALIPDSYFARSSGYEAYRQTITQNWIDWEKRTPVAYWRGSSTGNGNKQEWRNMPRFQLCQLAAGSDVIDAKIGALTIGFKNTPFAEEIKASGLLNKREDPEQGLHYKYLIDIDGFSNAYSGLFKRLLSGSVVLKVESAKGYQQWYYDKLIPWENYVPIKSDLSDLEETIHYLRKNDQKAKSIGEQGRKLALAITNESAIAETLLKFDQALKKNLSVNNPHEQRLPYVLNLATLSNPIKNPELFFYHGFPKHIPIKTALLSTLPRHFMKVKNGFISEVALNADKNAKGLLGALYENGQLIEGASYRGPGSALPIDPPTINAERIKQARVIKGSCVYMGWLLHSFGHLLLESPARFWIINEIDVANSRFIFHPLHYRDNYTEIPKHFLQKTLGKKSSFEYIGRKNVFQDEWTQTLLESFGISKEQIVLAEQDLYVEELIIPSSQFFLNQLADPTQFKIYQHVKNYLLDDKKTTHSINPASQLVKKIYLSRRLLKKAIGNRKANNEELIEKLFSAYGFDIVYPEQLSLQKQVQLISGAEMIAGCDGSALHMGIFLPKNAKIIILTNRGLVRNQLIMSALGNTTTHYINARKNQSGVQTAGAWEADIEFIQKELDKIITISP